MIGWSLIMDYREQFAAKPDDKVRLGRIDPKGGHDDTDSQRSATRPGAALVAAHGIFVGVCTRPYARTLKIGQLL
jgi:hypothetical protein